jgi:hypothetical protein
MSLAPVHIARLAALTQGLRVLPQQFCPILDYRQPRPFLDPLKPHPLTAYGRRNIRDSGRGGWACCQRVPYGEENP